MRRRRHYVHRYRPHRHTSNQRVVVHNHPESWSMGDRIVTALMAAFMYSMLNKSDKPKLPGKED